MDISNIEILEHLKKNALTKNNLSKLMIFILIKNMLETVYIRFQHHKG